MSRDPNAPVELAARRTAWALHYLIRNATKGHGDEHGAVAQVGERVADLVEAIKKELSA